MSVFYKHGECSIFIYIYMYINIYVYVYAHQGGAYIRVAIIFGTDVT